MKELYEIKSNSNLLKKEDFEGFTESFKRYYQDLLESKYDSQKIDFIDLPFIDKKYTIEMALTEQNINYVSWDKIYNLIEEKQRENLKKNSIQYALGGIMVRNMSHNIGSHVLTRANIENIVKRLDDLI
jgi:hypothetical protein